METLIQNKLCHGFRLLHTDTIQDIHSEAYVFEHEKSGARLLFLKNDDDNKVFSISFRTPPENNTGVFHILEHSVLCGSDKYPVKEPFVELLKGSLNTFLNAFTFSDKTMYPVASKNDKDFKNLMDVYLDAVFHPNIYKYKEILQQEGWHYELENAEDPINYKGVVYNEMKGAFSSPEGLLMRANQNSLFPDTSYGYESGGDPLYIPDLTQDYFEQCHKKYYSPANSYIYLYGNMDIEEKLAYLDQAYLSSYDRIDVDSAIAVQKPIGKINEVIKEYPVLPDSDLNDKTYLSMNFAVSTSTDPETYLAFDILDYLLLDSPAAPLKKAILDAGIGQDVFGAYDNSILQPFFSVNVKNANENQKEDFKKVVVDTLKKLVKDGLDKKQIEAAITVKEFQLREADYGSMPKGLIYSIMAMDSWLYDEDPTIHLKFEGTLTKIKQALTSNYFEALIEKYLLNSNHQTFVTIAPSKTIADKEAKQVEAKLADVKKNLNADGLQQIIEETKQLKERQSSADKPEDLRKIPMLSLDDVEKKAEELPLKEVSIEGIKTLQHDLETNKIAYVSLYFDASNVSVDQISCLSLLQEILGKVDTEKYPYSDLVSEINIQTGGIDFDNQTYGDKSDDDAYAPKFSVKTKVLTEKLPQAFALIHEILYHSKFDDASRIREIVKEIKSRVEMAFNQNGQSVVVRRLGSYFSQAAAYSEKLRGLDFYQFISDLDKNWDDRFDQLTGTLSDLAKQLFSKDQLVASITGDASIFSAVQGQFNQLDLQTQAASRETSTEKLPEPTSKNEGLMTSSKVQYAAKGANFKSLGFSYSGKLQVLKKILSLDYLWNQVRVMGGAYGCGIALESAGNIIFWSYRDPNLKETLTIYDESAKFAESFDADDFEMTKYIIGTLSDLDTPLTPRSKGSMADAQYFKKITQADIQETRDNVLATTLADIHEFAKLLKAVTDQGLVCVLGNESKIQQNKDLFKSVINVFE
ncbi:insulinase family protein [Sporolactobacillus laevolacticus]|uniref:Peptidase M16 n=1 Tax=Sporolactobacillus laevolacticus DSM 442 TaxID=1395513 RepID=V6IYN5_9BACL|nr:insulinase family protein [Sporolactobacillus laevolacticus]EST12603.1 peptidase M16 [Sporolactobacillus laevolacticus DSM 442]